MSRDSPTISRVPAVNILGNLFELYATMVSSIAGFLELLYFVVSAIWQRGKVGI